MNPDLLVIFARRPVPGAVKTRLAAAIGARAAARIYAAFVADLAARFRDAPFEVRWAIAPPIDGFAARFGLAPETCVAQSGPDLGARMRSTFSAARAEGRRRCVLVGSDMPHLPRAAIDEAFAALGRADLVLGPAEDGGYYLIAMREAHDVFSGVPWSTPAVRAETRTRAEALGLRVLELAPGFDVDTAADLDRLRALLDASGAADPPPPMPATRAAVRTR